MVRLDAEQLTIKHPKPRLIPFYSLTYLSGYRKSPKPISLVHSASRL